ncbi:unnamed protein product [Prorocentrum cordatum]|uniref:Uncharacterized protein n=1 Tax=Prorocentrum cordatum TaxID=2364126 RepID=A0ABN9Y5Q3_9DINO|nr:unnamed protein product [Polarella glacialis]
MADVVDMQADIKHLTLSQLLYIRCSNLGFAATTQSVRAQGDFLDKVDAQLDIRLAARLAGGRREFTVEPSKVQEVEGAGPDSLWLFRAGALEGLLRLQECQLEPLGQSRGVFCHRSLARNPAGAPRMRRQLHWEEATKIVMAKPPIEGKEVMKEVAMFKARLNVAAKIFMDNPSRSKQVTSLHEVALLGSEGGGKSEEWEEYLLRLGRGGRLQRGPSRELPARCGRWCNQSWGAARQLLATHHGEHLGTPLGLQQQEALKLDGGGNVRLAALQLLKYDVDHLLVVAAAGWLVANLEVEERRSQPPQELLRVLQERLAAAKTD